MNHVRIKIEGLTDFETARQVADLGADAIGLVFAPSPRQVTPETALEIVQALPPFVSSVGVFVNEDPQEINAIIEWTGITTVQLHGDETLDQAAEIRVPVIKAFAISDEESLARAAEWMQDAPLSTSALLDAHSPTARGGTGQRFDWGIIASAGEGLMADLDPFILAGGLNPQNVREAIAATGCWAVDVASGVESAPGIKDLDKVKAFIEAVRLAQ